jgi:hypothetical protein
MTPKRLKRTAPPAFDVITYRRSGRTVQRVNVDFPIDILDEIDREATRLGVTRQSFIKMRLAATLPSGQPTVAKS